MKISDDGTSVNMTTAEAWALVQKHYADTDAFMRLPTKREATTALTDYVAAMPFQDMTVLLTAFDRVRESMEIRGQAIAGVLNSKYADEMAELAVKTVERLIAKLENHQANARTN